MPRITVTATSACRAGNPSPAANDGRPEKTLNENRTDEIIRREFESDQLRQRLIAVYRFQKLQQ